MVAGGDLGKAGPNELDVRRGYVQMQLALGTRSMHGKKRFTIEERVLEAGLGTSSSPPAWHLSCELAWSQRLSEWTPALR